MHLTIIYDNDAWLSGLRPDWGFSCLIQGRDMPTILFDTGAQGRILLSNMRELEIDPQSIDMVFISHGHFDHTGGLSDFLKINHDVQVFVPYSLRGLRGAREIVPVQKSLIIQEGICSTGELRSIEQSLVLRTQAGNVIVAGCSHPGVDTILHSSTAFGKPCALVGGLHGFDQFDILQDLDLICPTHCTRFKMEMERLYPQSVVEGGAGRGLD